MVAFLREVALLLQDMGILNYLPLLLTLRFSLGESLPRCKCFYGQTCWPDAEAFSDLASQVSQPLLHPVPPASACYPPSSPSGNCSDVVAHYVDGVWRSNQPGASQEPNFETFIFPNGTISACYLNTTLGIPCRQGSVPPMAVNASSAQDIQVAVKFSSKHNLRVVIKNTGHDYLGRSAGRGGFLIWTHNLKDMSYDPSFVPEGAPSKTEETFQAVTFGAGVQWYEAYPFVQQQGRFVIGGISVGGSVGAAGGWIMGAGHSAFSPTFGLGVDNVLQFNVVLADGSLVTTNAHQHPDLFWALRGGGGGTYGVLISATYNTHPSFPFSIYYLTANFTTHQIAEEVVAEFIRIHPAISDEGWGGYSSISPGAVQVGFAKPNVSGAEAAAAFASLTEVAVNATGGRAQTFTLSYPSFLDWYDANFAGKKGQVGSQVYITSRLLSQKVALEDPAKVAQLILSLPSGVGANSVAGGAVSRADPSSTGLNPSWRGALSEIYTVVAWPEGASAATIAQQVESLKKSTDILDQISVDSGAYLNEASLFERDFKKSFFGSHYSKLKSIKTKYDPTSLFVVAEGVGSDEWDSSLECRV